jgi:hypothetical protein
MKLNDIDITIERGRKLAYSRQEAAKLLGISANSLDRLTSRGLLRPSRALRKPLFAEAELLRFLEATS